MELTIQETRAIPERMAVDGKIRLERTAITKRIGQLFVDRASINLHSDILDHPDFFWEDDEWLSLYLKASKYLEIERRAEPYGLHAALRQQRAPQARRGAELVRGLSGLLRDLSWPAPGLHD